VIAAALDYNSHRIDALAADNSKAVSYWAINANILRNRVKAAMSDWITNGYKNDYEQIAAYIAQVEGRDLVLLKQRYIDELRVSTSEILVFAHARVLLPTGDYQTIDTQDLRIPLPSGDTLQLKFDVGVGEVDVKVNAPDADAAIAKALQSPQLKGHLVKGDLKAESVGNQQFRVTGKFLSGDITLL
jgi:hypothetical protein